MKKTLFYGVAGVAFLMVGAYGLAHEHEIAGLFGLIKGAILFDLFLDHLT